MGLGRLRRLDQVAEAKWLAHGKTTAPRATARRGRRRAWLDALDRSVLGRRYSDRWLWAASAVGLALLAVMIIAMIVGRNGIPFAEPELGLVFLVLPLMELWRRRRTAKGQPPPLVSLDRLDEKFLRRKR